MPGFLANSRSSDSFDFELSAAVKDIEELKLAEKVALHHIVHVEVVSRMSSKTSATIRGREKIAVFRDRREQDVAFAADADRDLAASCAAPSRTSTVDLHQSDFESINMDSLSVDVGPHAQDVSDDTSGLVARLHALSAKREELLRQLSTVLEEESIVLGQLKQRTSITPADTLPSQTHDAISYKSSLPLNAPLLPVPMPSPSRLPHIQSAKMARKPLHT